MNPDAKQSDRRVGGSGAPNEVVEIEVTEDFTSSARCDEGFLHVRRLRCQNRRRDGSASKIYRVDMVDRPRLDAVAVLVHRQGEQGREVLLRENLRPAAYFRKDKQPAIADPERYLRVREIVAGLLEETDKGEAGLRFRGAEEVWEEAGIRVTPEEMQPLGGAFFVAPGIISEKIFLLHVDVTGREQVTPKGDGSPLEEGGALSWHPFDEVLASCRSGALPDAKTELALSRFVAFGS